MQIIYSNWDPETHVSTVRVRTKYGVHEASVVTDPEDYDIENQWDGCALAFFKCNLKAKKAEYKRLYERYVATEHILNVYAADHGDIDREEFIHEINTTEWLSHQAQIAKRDYAVAREQYFKGKSRYKELMEARLQSRRDIRDKIAD